MKIAYIAAGAGGMYCGSCLRDNTLAAALMDAGHDVLLIPAYTPTRTDERNVSHGRVFLGGINVYLQEHFAFFRKTGGAMDRIWDSAPLLRLASRWGVSVDPVRLGRLTISMLRGAAGLQKKEVLNLVRFLADEVAPEIINLPNSLLISLAPEIKKATKAPVCCTLQGEDLFLDSLGEPYRSEAVRLIAEHARSVDAFIAVSHFGARRMADYLGLEPSRIHVAPLGISLNGYEQRTTTAPDPFTVGYLARITPEKGLHALCEAYRKLRLNPGLPPSRLWAAGYLAREQRSYLSGIRRSLISCGLSGHFQYHGELDRPGKIAFLKGLSVFSMPAPYDDSKGLSLLEAMAGGIPVVQPRRGAFTEIVESTGGGILVEPDNPEALAAGILDLWRDPEKRMELGARGAENVRRHYSAAVMAERVLSIYNRVTGYSTPELSDPLGDRGLSSLSPD
jgi:glycosyltransferase involved in cell wall biosynthesis